MTQPSFEAEQQQYLLQKKDEISRPSRQSFQSNRDLEVNFLLN